MKRFNLLGIMLSGALLAATIGLTLGRSVEAQGNSGQGAQVTVVNTPLPIRNVDRPERQPFRATAETNFALAVNTQVQLATVPAGKQLVIEEISWRAFAPTGDQIIVGALRAGADGPLVSQIQINPPHASLISSFILQDGSQPARLYFSAGEEVWAAVSATTQTDVGMTIMVSGHFIDP